MSVHDVTVEQRGAHVGVVCLRRPPNNYFDAGLIEDVAAAYEELDGSGWCRAVVLASKGRHFCAGLDFAGNAGQDIAALYAGALRLFAAALPVVAAVQGAAIGGGCGLALSADFRVASPQSRHFCAGLDFAGNAGQDIAALYAGALRLFAAALPVVAAVQGAAIGGGCGLALSADFRVASPQSRFSANFARLGFHHGFALTVTLPAVVGRQAAADLLLTGRRVGGEEALALGLCDRLAADGDELAQAIGYADELAGSGPLAVRSIRATLRGNLVEEARLAMEHEYAEQTRLRHTADFAEGVCAAAERRTPSFRGA